MTLRLLNGKAVRAALSMPDAIAAVRAAYVSCSSGSGVAPDRVHVELAGEGNVALFMPGYMPATGEAPSSLVIKAVTVFPQNPQRGLPMNQGALLAIDAETGCACGLLDTAAVTALRTAAGSAAATDCLARADASTLAMLGTGVLGPVHVEAVNVVRDLRAVHLWGRTRAHADALAERLRDTMSAPITVHDDPNDAVREADIVCTATPSTRPLFDAGSVRPGTHLNAVGAFRPTMCELPPETIAQARVFIDRLPAAKGEAGDLIQAIEDGQFAWNQVVGEIGAVIAGDTPGRTSDDEVTVFKSVGISLQDAAAAAAALANAERDGIGNVIPWP